MSDSKPKSQGVEGDDQRGDLRLSVIQRGFPHYTHRQIQRWAESGKIPGAYRLKRGRGHWRVRNCLAFRRWWFLPGRFCAKCPLSWAIEGDIEEKRHQQAERMLKALPRDWRARLFAVNRKITEERPMNHRLRQLIGMHTRTGTHGYLDKKPHRYWWDTPDNKLPRKLVKWARQATDQKIAVMAAVGDLIARHEKTSVKNVAANIAVSVDPDKRRTKDSAETLIAFDTVGVSVATFYRRGYDKHLKEYLNVFGEDAPVFEKDSRAKRLYKDQTLQETESEQ